MAYPSFGKAQVKKRSNQKLQMQGINLTDNYADGQMESSKGISTDRFPYITTQQRLVPIDAGIPEGYHAVSIFSWEKLFVVTDEPSEDGGYKCYYGGEYCGDAKSLELPKQYAVVNSKLCMFPDKIMFSVMEENLKASNMTTAPELLTVVSGTVETRKAVQ